MPKELEGKVAIVTGGASGIGRAAAIRFVEAGAHVVVADLRQERGEALVSDFGGCLAYRHIDVSQTTDVEGLVNFAVDHFGRLDVMFNNAGISGNAHSRFVDDDLTDFHRVMSINLLGVMLGCRFAGRHMAAHGGGSIINTASVGGQYPGYGVMTYRASKAAVLHFTKSLAIDFAASNVRVNSISPGAIATEMTTFRDPGGLPAETVERLKLALNAAQTEGQPLKREGLPNDIAEAALFLASDRSVFVTGIDIPVAGAMGVGDPVNQLDRIIAASKAVLGG